MDYDRKSAVSSFYGGPRATFDPSDADGPSVAQPLSSSPFAGERVRVDSNSTFFDPSRVARSGGEPANGRLSSAGYNRSSFFDVGRQEPLRGGYDEEEAAPANEEPWDIYADFNNAGPRYSTAFVQPNNAGYRQIPTPSSDVKTPEATPLNDGNVEMVTVPTLGPEWKKSELKEMTKSGRREEKLDSRMQQYKSWRRGERGMCGRWFSYRFTVFFVFAVFVAIGIVLAFTIPRVPGLVINPTTPLQQATGSFNASIPMQFSRAPLNFTFAALGDLQLDTTSNYLPLTFTGINAQIFDLDTDMLIGTGSMGSKTVPAKAYPNIQLPLNFSYVTTNQTDITWNSWYNACKSPLLYSNGSRPGVNFRLEITMKIAGLIGSKGANAQITDAACPFQLPENYD